MSAIVFFVNFDTILISKKNLCLHHTRKFDFWFHHIHNRSADWQELQEWNLFHLPKPFFLYYECYFHFFFLLKVHTLWACRFGLQMNWWALNLLCKAMWQRTQCNSSWRNDVVRTLPQRRCWRCHNVVARSKMRMVPTSVSDVVTMSLSDVVKTLLQRRHNIKHWITRSFYHWAFWFLYLDRNLKELEKC